MRVTGMTAIFAGLLGTALLALLALPARASGAPGASEPAAVTTPALVPEAPVRTLDVPADELVALPPAEPPPGDFTAAQYIDSAGCVFVRTPDGWRARIARDGSAICGYPPTFSARRAGPDVLQPLFPEPAEPRARRMERQLTEAILPNLHDGELADGAGGGNAELAEVAEAVRTAARPDAAGAAGDAVDADAVSSMPDAAIVAGAASPAIAPPPPEADALGFAAAARGAPVLAAAGTSARSDRLCRLIGASAKADSGLGGSSALGLCGGEAAPLAAMTDAAVVVAPIAPAAQAVADAGRQPGQDRTFAATGRGKDTSKSPGDSSASARRKGLGRKALDRKAAQKGGSRLAARGEGRDAALMIPPGARYVQVGAFRDAGNADRTARRLLGMGLPVVQSRQGATQHIMVGPLAGRESVVRTIDRVRRAGYRDAYARR